MLQMIFQKASCWTVSGKYNRWGEIMYNMCGLLVRELRSMHEITGQMLSLILSRQPEKILVSS